MRWRNIRAARRAVWPRLAVLVVLVAGMLGGGSPQVGAQAARPVIDPERVGYPRSMAALGDSITAGFLSTPNVIGDAPENSWSTGTTASVSSHYARILAAEPLIGGKNLNVAVSGNSVADLAGQVAQAVTANSEYVTILIGANDVCKATEGAMTPVPTFRSQLSTALAALSSGLPDARIFVLGMPDVYKVWELSHTNPQAQAIWNLGLCQTMFANPTSTADADIQRRARVRAHLLALNVQLAEVCAEFIHCRYSNVLAEYALQPADLAQDYYHPSLSGQARLAAATFAQTFQFTDTVAPVTTAQVAPSGEQHQITLGASDSAGVSGIEYRLGTGTWQRYQAPLTVDSATVVIYRAVDRNGNIEGSRAVVIPTRRIYLPLIGQSSAAPTGQRVESVIRQALPLVRRWVG